MEETKTTLSTATVAVMLSVIVLAVGSVLLASNINVNAQEATDTTSTDTEFPCERPRGMMGNGSFGQLDETREQFQVQHEATLQEALGNGTLSQEDYDLSKAIQSVMDEIRDEVGNVRDDYRGTGIRPTEEEMQTMHDQMQQTLIDRLAEQGFNLTSDDLEAHRETMQSLGLGFQGRGPRF